MEEDQYPTGHMVFNSLSETLDIWQVISANALIPVVAVHRVQSPNRRFILSSDFSLYASPSLCISGRSK